MDRVTQNAERITPSPRIQAVGLNGLLVNFAESLTDAANRAALSFRADVEDAAIAGVVETTSSLVSVLVLFDPLSVDAESVPARLLEVLDGKDWADAPLPANRRLWRIPAVFGGDRGPQLAEAAELAGMEPDMAVTEMTKARLRVMSIGFAPGQPYLGTLPAHWNIPRQSGLTKQVPNGAIAVAIRQLVLFTAPAPTGWRMIGQTAFRGFRPDQDEPFALRAGDEVQFDAISEVELAKIEARDQSGDGGATIEVIE